MKDLSPLKITEAAVGFPARLCTITRKDGNIYRCAESDEPITIGGITWNVVPGLQISAVKHTSNGEMPSAQLLVVHNRGTIFDSNDIDVGLFDAAAVQIYIVDRMNLSTPKLLFTGAIGNISYNVENQLALDIQGATAFGNILMTQKRSPMCRTDLYSELCGVNPDTYRVLTRVDAIIDAYNFTVGPGFGHPDGYFTQGVMLFNNGVSLEIANWVNASQTITTYVPSSRLISPGLSLTLWPGCDKTMTDTGCGKYSNWKNFQGEPHFTGTAAASQQVP